MTQPVVDFGKDISCTTSLRTGRYATGPRLVAEAAYRRLTTPRGMLRGGEDEANYGIDLLGLIGQAPPKTIAAALPQRIQSELSKDERIATVNVVVTVTTKGPSTTFNIAISGTTAQGPFSLKLSVNEVTIELVGLDAAA